MKKFFTTREYNFIIAKIMAMDLLARSFNDEEFIERWLANGVPDGLDSRGDYESMYPNNKDLELNYRALSAFFCRLIAMQAVSIREAERGVDFPPQLIIDGAGIII